MQIGFVGLGKMGGNMALRLTAGTADRSVQGGHQVIGYARDPNPDLVGAAGIELVGSLDQMVAKLVVPRVVWVMVPAGNPTETVVTDLAGRLQAGDIVIDGGNSYYKDSIRRGEGLAKHGIHFIDCGTSGGVWGRQEGYCLMIGGAKEAVDHCQPIFQTLAPPDGWGHVGPLGSGHFTKMIHNGIEYGLMAAYGEGFEILYKSKFNLDLQQISGIWNHGSVIRSWLLELAQRQLAGDIKLTSILPFVEDSGEGRWTIKAAMDADVPVPVISSALFARFQSRDPYNFSARFVSGLRHQFGGHTIKKVEPENRRTSPSGPANT